MVDGKGFVMILVVSSFFEMWAAGSVCDIMGECKNEWAFAVAIGAISLITCLLFLPVYFFVQPGTCLKVCEAVVSVLMFLLWLVSIMICTFYKPFSTMCLQNTEWESTSSTELPVHTYGAANGYLTNWISFCAAGAWMATSITFVNNLVTKVAPSSLDGYLLGALGMFSVIAMAQGAYLCNNRVPGYNYGQTAGGGSQVHIFNATEGNSLSLTFYDGCQSGYSWIISWGTISLVLALLMMFVKALDWLVKWIASIMCIVWGMSVLILCFYYRNNDDRHTGIYNNAGNGFIATWACTLICFAIAWCGWSGMTMGEAFAHSGVYIPIIFVASFFEFWAACVVCDRHAGHDDVFGDACSDELAFAVAVGMVGMALSLTQLLLRIFCKDCAAKTQFWVACSLWVWFMVSVAVVCFKKPFTSFCTADPRPHCESDVYTSGNGTATQTYQSNGLILATGDASGWFCTWVCMFASTMMLMENQTVMNLSSKLQGSHNDSVYIMPLCMMSAVLFAQAAYTCGENSCDCGHYYGWAIAAGVLSFVICLVLIFISAIKDFAKYVYVFLTLLWFTCVATLTFKYKDADDSGVFAVAGNGFFACWLGLANCVLLVYIGWVDPDFSLTREEEAKEGDAEPGDAAPGVEANPTADIEMDKADGDDDDAPATEVPVEENGEPETAKV